jgi:hypothetical protein
MDFTYSPMKITEQWALQINNKNLLLTYTIKRSLNNSSNTMLINFLKSSCKYLETRKNRTLYEANLFTRKDVISYVIKDKSRKEIIEKYPELFI